MIIIASARQTLINIIYSGKDITQDIAPYLTAFTFTDNAKDKADDISLTLQDARGEWLRDWLPSKSDLITASIIKYDGQQAMSLPCGSFTVDQIDYSLPPHTLSIKAVSASVPGTAKCTKKTRHWENASLSAIAGEIAGDNGLGLRLQGDGGHVFERLDQTEQADLDFLRELCHDFGLAVKIQTKELWIYDEAEFEAQASAYEMWSDDGRLISARFSSKTANIYKTARLTYHHASKDKVFTGSYTDEEAEGTGKELLIHERVESDGEAQKRAKERLLEANRSEVTGSIVLMGDVRLASGITVTLGGFGMFSGKHFVNKAVHKVDSSGFTTTLELGRPQEEKGKNRKSKRQSSASKRKTGRKGSTGELFYEGEKYYH